LEDAKSYDDYKCFSLVTYLFTGRVKGV